MPQFLTDFLVLSESGKVVFSEGNSFNIDEQLIGGFLFACVSCHETLFVNELKSVEFKTHTIFFYKKKQFFFVGFSKKSVSTKAAQGNLEYLGNKFVDTYRDLPIDWDSDLTLFRNFHQEVEKTKKERALDVLMERFHE